MRNLIALVALLILGAACDDVEETCFTCVFPEDGPKAPDASWAPCDPVAHPRCASDLKCAWIRIDAANGAGELGCVPAGTKDTGSACAYGPDGPETGYDDCVTGNVCIDGLCREYCTFTPDTCPATCATWPGYLEGTDVGACTYPI